MPPIFEILKKRPAGFPEFVPYVGENAKLQGKCSFFGIFVFFKRSSMREGLG